MKTNWNKSFNNRFIIKKNKVKKKKGTFIQLFEINQRSSGRLYFIKRIKPFNSITTLPNQLISSLIINQVLEIIRNLNCKISKKTNKFY